MNCVKGEIHNVLSMMRVNARWASVDRFTQEIPASTQSPLMRAFKQLHYELQSVADLADVDTVAYLLPFVLVIESERTSGFITGAALSAVNKFLLYGLITSDSLRADVAINRIAVCASRCRFEETHRADDEAVLMKLLELVEYCVRCDAGHLISDENLWKMLQLCYSIRCQPRSSMHLCRAADNTLSHLVLTVFDRIDELEPQRKTSRVSEENGDKEVEQEGQVKELTLELDESLDIGEEEITAAPPLPVEPLKMVVKTAHKPYGIPLLERILHFISGLISPTENEEVTCVLGLRLINVVLETAGTGLGNHPCLVSVLQGDLSKFLLQNSETEELGILSLTLRVVFNLFNSIKDHLKVQLEVFFTSVHMRIIDSPSCSDEQKELALESLLEFCREPALMLDLYINYDCDVHCTNLFEVLCKSLAKNCQSMSGPDGNLNALTLLCLEGLLAVIESIARRCPLNTPAKTSGSRTFGNNAGILSLKGSDLARFTSGASPGTENSSGEFPMEDISPMSSVRDLMHLVMSGSESDSDSEQSEPDNPADQLAWLHTARERTAEVLQQRKRAKKRYALAAEKFNHDQKNWMAFSQQIGLLPEKLTPESVASFLLHTPGLNKTLIGDYIGDGPVEKYPFNAAVRDAYVAMFDFRSAPSLDEALRMFLAKFRLPGEAQKIDRMMEAFSKQLYLQAGSSGPLADADAAYVLSFSIIMLNTDLHSDHIAKKMTVEEFIRNNRGINAGQDLPTEYLTDLYYNILEKEIQMQHDVSDFMEAPSSTVDRYSMQWDGVLKRSENVVGASFTSNTSILKLRAGLYEKDMFNLISESTIKCILLAFEKTCDLNNMERTLEGVSNCAKIMLYYDMNDEFNKIMGALASYFLTFAHGILSGEKVYVPPSSSGVLKRKSSTSLPSPTEHGSTETIGERIVRRQDDGSEIEVLATPQQPGGSIDEDLVQGAKTRRALLSLKLLFQFVQNKNEYFRKGWANVVECMLMFNELDAVPTSLVEIDDFVDSRGVPLPPMQGGSAHSPSPPKLSPGRGQGGTGLSGKTRERSRRQAERQAAIRSRMKSMTQASQGTAYGSHGQSTNSGSIWGSLSYYLWAEEEKIDESFSLVNKMLREEVMKLGGGILEKENWLRLTRKLQEQALTSLLETLISCRDPFKCIMQPSDSGVDAMMQENAILVLELSVDIILVNSHRILQLNLWDSFHLYAKRILSTPLNELHMQGLVERVVVHILRVSIRLFHDEKVRPKLMATLELLLTMDKDMYKALSDRLASGITMLLKANLVYMHDFHDWEVLLGILQNVVEYINSRSACWESVLVLAEGGHLDDDNFTPWMSLCCGFVRHRTSYAVDALKLLQGLANSDNTHKMNGSSWLQVMRVMLNYLNDDRPPVAKTAWDCLRNSLLLPGVPIAKDTWKKCFDEIIFAFDDQVNNGTVRMARDAPLYSVTLLSKTFLHNLNVLMELSDFPELWLKVLRRLANKLVPSTSPTMRPQQSSVVFETTLQSLYNLLLVLKAEDILERVSTEGSSETLFDETCAVIDAVCPHLKEQLGLLPDDVAIEMPATATDGNEQSDVQPTAEATADESQEAPVETEADHQTTHEEEAETAPAVEDTKTEAASEQIEDTAADEETLARLIPGTESQVEVAASVDEQADETKSDPVETPVSSSSGPPTSTTTLETVIIGDGTFGIKVDEVIVDEITEAV